MPTPLVVVHNATDADAQSPGDSCYDDLCRTLGLDAAPPYWFLFIGMTVTPLIHANLFGPLRLRSQKTPGTFATALLYWTIISFGLTMLLDVITLIEVAESGLGFGQRLSAVVMIIAFSPNTSAGIALSAVGSVYEQAKLWRQDYGRGGDWPTFDEALVQKGPLYAYYRKMAHWAGAIPGVLAFTYCIPAFCAYCWIFISIGSCLFCLSWSVCPFLIRIFLGRAAKKRPTDTEAGRDTESKDADDYSGEEGDNEPFLTEEPEVLVEWMFVTLTGAPRQSWAQFWFALLMIYVLALIGPMAARLYSGAGYLNALSWTVFERGFGGLGATWLSSLFNGGGGPASLGRVFLAINWLS